MYTEKLRQTAECLCSDNLDELDEHLEDLPSSLYPYLLGGEHGGDFYDVRYEASIEGLLNVFRRIADPSLIEQYGRRLLRDSKRTDVFYALTRHGLLPPHKACSDDCVRALFDEDGGQTIKRLAQISHDHAHRLSRSKALYRKTDSETRLGVLNTLPEGALIEPGEHLLKNDDFVHGALRHDCPELLRALIERLPFDRDWWLDKLVDCDGGRQCARVLTEVFEYPQDELAKAFNQGLLSGSSVRALAELNAVPDEQVRSKLLDYVSDQPEDWKTLELIQAQPGLERDDIETIYDSDTFERGLDYLVPSSFLSSLYHSLIDAGGSIQPADIQAAVAGLGDRLGRRPSQQARLLSFMLDHADVDHSTLLNPLKTVVQTYVDEQLSDPRVLLSMAERIPITPGQDEGVVEVLLEAAVEAGDQTGSNRDVFLNVLRAVLSGGRAQDLSTDRIDRLYELALWEGHELVEALVESGCVPSPSIVTRIDTLDDQLGHRLRDNLNRREQQYLNLQE